MVIATQPVDTSTYPVAAFPDDEILGAMLDAHRQSAFNLAYRLVRRPEDAADAVQDAFVLAVRATRGETAAPRDADRFRPWLLKIVANVALGQLRRKRSDVTASLDDLTFEPADSRGEQPLAALMRRERRGDVLNALLVLPDDQRIALTLREYQELSYDEIGQMLGLDRTATTALIYRARCAFRKAYQGLMVRSAPIGCPELAPLMSAMLDEELNASTWRDVEQHVAGCRGCRFELRQLRSARRLHATIPLLAPPAGWSWAATLEAAQTVGGVGAASLATNAVSLAPAATTLASASAASALPGAFLGGLLTPFGGLLTGRMTGMALIVGLNFGVMVGAPAHLTAPQPLVQAQVVAPASARQDPSVAPDRLDVAGGSDRLADGSQPAAPPASATAPDSASASGTGSSTEPASVAGLADASPPASAPAEAARQSTLMATVSDAAQAGDVVVAGPPSAETASPAASQPSDAEAPAASQSAASAQAAPGVAGAGPAAGESAAEPVTSTVAAVVDVVSGLPQGDLPSLDLPPVDLPAIDVPPIDLPAIDVPPIDLTAVDLPPIQAPPIDVPPVDVPPVTLPVAGVPPVDLPPVDVPAIQAPAVDVPAVDVPAIDLPAVDLPAVNPSAIQLPVADLPAVQIPGDQAKHIAAPAARESTPEQQTLSNGTSLVTQSDPGSGLVDASLTSVGDNKGKGSGSLVEVHTNTTNATGADGATHVDANVSAPTILSDSSGANTLVDASSGVSSVASDGGSNSLTVHSEVGNSGSGTGVNASVDSGTGAGVLESNGAGNLGVNGSVSVSVDNNSGSGSLESNTSFTVSVDNNSGGGGNDSNSSGSVSVSFDSSSTSGGGGDNGSNSGGGGGGNSISVGGISISLP